MSVLDLIPGVAQIRTALVAIAGGTVVFSVMLLIYEGIPLGPLRDIPIVGPVLEFTVDGRVDRQRRAGALSERLKWEELRNKQIAQNARKLLEAQLKVDDWARRFREKESALQATLGENSSLEQALAETRKEAEDAAKNADPGNPVCPPRPAISRRVSRELNKLGR